MEETVKKTIHDFSSCPRFGWIVNRENAALLIDASPGNCNPGILPASPETGLFFAGVVVENPSNQTANTTSVKAAKQAAKNKMKGGMKTGEVAPFDDMEDDEDIF